MDTRYSDFFVAGGALRSNAPSYVRRVADELLPGLLAKGKLCYVLNTRQMGKSSLVVRMIDDLRKQGGVKTVYIELNTIGTATDEMWFYSLVSEIAYQLNTTTDVRNWWKEHNDLAYVSRFIKFLQNIVLGEVEERIAIFLDEIDTVLKFDFSDDFFAAIRALYNNQAVDKSFQKLSFVLLGVAAPHDLIKDQTRTPFNVGYRIRLDELKLEDAQIMVQGLPQRGEAILERIFFWTNGHPYLTQKIGYKIAQNDDVIWTDERIDALVHELFLTDKALVEESNLQFVRDRMLSSTRKDKLLDLYRQIRQGKQIKNDEQSPTHNELKLYGLVRVEDQEYLTIRNRIYQDVFDLDWIKENQPVNWRRHVVIVVIAVLFMLSMLLYILWQRPQPVDVLAESYINNFESTTNPILRLDNLAKLYALPGYLDEADELFTSLTDDEKAALLINEASTSLLEAQLTTLKQANNKENKILIAEISNWLTGRNAALVADYETARVAFNEAINLNENNPVTRFERALVSVKMNDYQKALADLEVVLVLNRSLQGQVLELTSNEPLLYAELEENKVSFPILTELVLETTLCTEQKLRPGGRILCTFTSGLRQENGRQKISVGELSSGQYVLTLRNASPEYSGTWVVFDYLALKESSSEISIWEIGISNTPPDYSQRSWKEFCDPKVRPDCTAEFIIGTTDVGDFVKELNDWEFTVVKIYFEITDEQANRLTDLDLVLSTLYSTHEGADEFKMEVSLAGE